MESLFYRNYLKYLRNEFYIAQSEIADFLYCSISTYSKMEQGKKEISFKDFETVIHFYEKKNKRYSFCFDKNKKKEAKDLIRKCIIAFVYRSQKEILDELESYLSDPSNLHSYAFFETKLIEMIYDYFADLPFQERLPFMLEHMNLYDHTDQSLIYDLHGLSKLRAYDQSAIECFQSAKALSVLVNIPGWLGLIDYHLIITYLQSMNPVKAFPLFEECSREFQTAGAHRRILNLRFNQAQCFLKLGLFEEADQIHINLLQTYDQVDTDRFVAIISVNYSWSQFLQKNYANAIKLCQKALALHSQFPDLYITLSYSFYQLDEPEKALSVIADFRTQERTDPRSKMVMKFLDVLESYLLEYGPAFEHLANQLLPLLTEWKDLEIDLLIYQMLIDYHKAKQNEHALCDIQDKMIQFLLKE
ncbi:hypothetical protein C815_00590 [Firmicutes bacterium M10-2]|nr:hypothetical protein C815_00590 [Firmicutes bacterium M10-2]